MLPDRVEHRTKKLVLVVEDSQTQATQIRFLLKEYDLSVILAVDGHMGLHMAKDLIPDLIILDIQMPRMNGFELCKCLKENKKTQDIPVIILSHKDADEAIQMGRSMGVVDYIPKDAFAQVVLVETLRQMRIIST
jgi:CheY-like chemotaxis protein